jgi:TRAP transporter TAXI family solute receptor
MKGKISAIAISVILIMSMALASTATAAEVKKYVYASGTMGGTWRPGIGAAVQLINEQFKDKYAFTAASTQGAVENIRRMMSGEFDMGWVYLPSAYDAWYGVGIFKGKKPFKGIRMVEKIVDQGIGPVVLADSPIKTFSDLAGKNICMGAAGSGGIPIARAIFKALGIENTIKSTYISFTAGAEALKNKNVDATFIPGGPYISAALLEISRSTQLRVVEPTPEEAKKILKEAPYLVLGVIPPNKAPGVNSDRERKLYFYDVFWATLPRVPSQVVYDVLSLTQEPKNKEMLGKVVTYWLVAQPGIASLEQVGIPFHPGAAKYWQEKGFKIPAKLIGK